MFDRQRLRHHGAARGESPAQRTVAVLCALNSAIAHPEKIDLGLPMKFNEELLACEKPNGRNSDLNGPLAISRRNPRPTVSVRRLSVARRSAISQFRETPTTGALALVGWYLMVPPLSHGDFNERCSSLKVAHCREL